MDKQEARAQVLDLVLNESDATCEGCGADPREAAQDEGSPPDLDGWFLDAVLVPDPGTAGEMMVAVVRCPRCAADTRDLEFRQEFVKHLLALETAADHTQPLAEYAGNFSALKALVTLKTAAETILGDIERILDHTEHRSRFVDKEAQS